MGAPDFERLRAERDASLLKKRQKWADKHGVSVDAIHMHVSPGRCYCDCAQGGPCEHKWDGKPYESDGLWSTTCSLCGTTSFSHSMRIGM